MNRKITISSRFGKPTVSASGYDGDSCLAATERVERALGGGEGGVEIREFNPSVGVEEETKEVN